MKSYPATERRRRFVYQTRNTQYHLFDGVCVAVRSADGWARRHPALGRRLDGGVKVYDNGAVLPSLAPAEVGQALLFVQDHGQIDNQVVTSPLCEIVRPKLSEIQRYPQA